MAEEQGYVHEPHGKSEDPEEVQIVEKPLWKSQNCHNCQCIEVVLVPVEVLDDFI